MQHIFNYITPEGKWKHAVAFTAEKSSQLI